MACKGLRVKYLPGEMVIKDPSRVKYLWGLSSQGEIPLGVFLLKIPLRGFLKGIPLGVQSQAKALLRFFPICNTSFPN